MNMDNYIPLPQYVGVLLIAVNLSDHDNDYYKYICHFRYFTFRMKFNIFKSSQTFNYALKVHIWRIRRCY